MPPSRPSENEVISVEETTQEVEVVKNLEFQKASWIIKYIRTFALGLTMLGANVTTEGCATTSQNNKASASIIKDLITKLGARNSGLQIREDGTITGIINCEDDLDPSQALSKAEELNRSILEQTPDKTTSATKKLGDRTFACVRGEINPEPKTIDDSVKKLLKGTGYNQVGIFNDTVIQYGEGDTEESAIADAKKNIEFFLSTGTYTRTNTKTLQLKRGENKDVWIALIHAKKAPEVEIKERYYRFDNEHYGPGHIFIPNHKKPLKNVAVFVHGYRKTADRCWELYRMQNQFRDSGMKGLFIVPEAPKSYRESKKEYGWWKHKDSRKRDLPGLIRYAQNYDSTNNTASPVKLSANNKVIVISHSGGYFTTATWLQNKNVKVIVLQDSLYGFDNDFAKWAKKDGNLLILMPAGKTIRGKIGSTIKRTEKLAKAFKKKAYFIRKRPRDLNNEEIEDLRRRLKSGQLKVLHMEVPYLHYQIPKHTTSGILKLIDRLDSDK